jgi:hypothetical protein
MLNYYQSYFIKEPKSSLFCLQISRDCDGLATVHL